MMRFLKERVYPLYRDTRDYLGFSFTWHRTLETVSLPKVSLAWQKACEDNRVGGTKFLPAPIKAGLEICGVLVLALGGLVCKKNKSLLPVFGVMALLLFAASPSQQEDSAGGGGGGSDTSTSSSTTTTTSTCTHPSIYRVYDMGAGMEKCTFCGEYIVDTNS